ncbi:MAG: hypothetical protein H0T42_15925 [Deltaproteobacteria bacterium]|nr:hypothetical protein [Deltaproteobacteria bacterium]
MTKLLALTIVLATTATLHAESLEEKKFWKGEMHYLQREIDEAQKRCDTTFKFDWIDKEKFRAAAEKEKARTSPQGICANIIKETARLCRMGEDEKGAVKAKITGFACGYSKPRKLDMSKGGVVTYLGNQEEHNFADWAMPWLQKKL